MNEHRVRQVGLGMQPIGTPHGFLIVTGSRQAGGAHADRGTGVRLSPGAASFEPPSTREYSAALLLVNVAAPGGGRAPAKSAYGFGIVCSIHSCGSGRCK